MAERRSARAGWRVLHLPLYLHLAANLTLAAVCIVLAVRTGAWAAVLYEQRLTPEGALAVFAAAICALAVFAAAICALDMYMFIRSIFRTVTELEQAIGVLQSAAEGSTGYDGATRRPTELLQLLLQREATAQLMTKQAEISALQNQINPHFLYNTLETIRGQALCCGAQEIAETTKALADIFRYNISRKGAMISLHEELANINSYMKIQQIRFQDRFDLRMDVSDDTQDIQIPKLLVQPVIENALKHGLEVKRGKGHILLRAFRTQQNLEIRVEDDGVGMPVDQLAALNEKLAARGAKQLGSMDGANIGLTNINDRIRLIYGEGYGVTVISTPEVGTKVILSLGIFDEESP